MKPDTRFQIAFECGLLLLSLAVVIAAFWVGSAPEEWPVWSRRPVCAVMCWGAASHQCASSCVQGGGVAH